MGRDYSGHLDRSYYRPVGSLYLRKLKRAALVEGIIIGFALASIAWYATLQFAR